MNEQATTGCNRCDTLHKEIYEMLREQWRTEDNPLLKEQHRFVTKRKKRLQAELDRHLIESHQLSLPF